MKRLIIFSASILIGTISFSAAQNKAFLPQNNGMSGTGRNTDVTRTEQSTVWTGRNTDMTRTEQSTVWTGRNTDVTRTEQSTVWTRRNTDVTRTEQSTIWTGRNTDVTKTEQSTIWTGRNTDAVKTELSTCAGGTEQSTDRTEQSTVWTDTMMPEEARKPLALDCRLNEETLRVNYIFSGTDKTGEISVDELCRMNGWAGRRTHMKEVPLRGNGQICMTTKAEGDTLYRMSFSTLFQEWQATEEAVTVKKSFENVFLLPMPNVPVNITVELYDFKDHLTASLTHPVDPSDILIRPVGGYTPSDIASLQTTDDKRGRYIHYSGAPEEKIDVAVVAEGYTEEEMETFFSDAEAAVESIFNHEPFATLKDSFNFIAVAAPSKDSGVSVPREGLWKETAVGSNFDTFYSDRYLTTLRLRQLHDVLSDVPYEHIIILANTDTYGGGGIYNSYTLTTAHHRQFKPVVVHEFGHSFGGLADEYFYDDQFVEYYYPGIEPWEKNITTLADFSAKWLDLLPEGTVVKEDGTIILSDDNASAKARKENVEKAGRTEAGKDAKKAKRKQQEKHEGAWLYEGGGYQSKGVWRGAEDCRMRTNEAPEFCPVCQQAITDIIRFYTEN